MKLGFVGLGKMGNQMVQRLILGGHEVVVKDLDEAAVAAVVDKGAVAADDYTQMVEQLGSPAIVWLMIPHLHVRSEIEPLTHAGAAGFLQQFDHGPQGQQRECDVWIA